MIRPQPGGGILIPLTWLSFKAICHEYDVDPFSRDEVEVEYPPNSCEVITYRLIEPLKKRVEKRMLDGEEGYQR